MIINRAQGSGTRTTFEQWVMKKRKTKPAQEQDSTGMVRSIVANTPGAISYLAFSYVDKTVATLKLDGIAPTDATWLRMLGQFGRMNMFIQRANQLV